jgi:hypothetical protein
LKQRVESSRLAAVFFGDSETLEYNNEFMRVAENSYMAEKQFGFMHIGDLACAKDFGISLEKTSVVLFRNFDESPLIFDGKIEGEALLIWLSSHSMPALVEFGEEYIQ